MMKILIIEDSRDDCLLLVHALKDGGLDFEYRRVEDSREMDEALKKEKWDAVISDYKLPRFSVKEALELLHKKEVDIPFIVVSGVIGEEYVAELFKDGAHDFIRKDNLERLIPAFKRELKDAETRRKEKQAKKDLYDSEEKYRLIVENAHDGIEISQNDRLIFFNSQFARMLGYKIKELKGVKFSKMFTDQAKKELYQRHEKREKGEKLPPNYETTFLKKDGTVIDVDVRFEIIDYKNKPATFGIIRDITERKQVEGMLRNSKHFIEKIVNTAPNFIYVIDIINKKYLFVNDAYEQMFGIPKENVLANDGYDFILSRVHPDDLKQIIEKEDSILEKLNDIPGEIKQEKVFEFVYRVKDKGDNWRWIYSWGSIFEINNNGKVCKILGIGQDITDRKQAEEVLHQYKHIVSSSTDMLALLDKRFTYLAANSSYIKTFKLTPEQLIGNTVIDVFGEEFFNATIKPNADRCLAGEEVNFQYWFDFPTSERCYMDITYYPYYGEDNNIIGFVVNGRDITTRKQVEEDLKENMNQLERFNKLAVGRELRMVELKREINDLLVKAGLEKKYSTP